MKATKPMTTKKLAAKPVKAPPAPPLTSPFPAAAVDEKLDVPAFKSVDEVDAELVLRRDRLVAAMREATAPIPQGISPQQASALQMLRVTANGEAMRVLGEFSSFLHALRGARWISFERFRDGVSFLDELRQRGPRAAPPAPPQPAPVPEVIAPAPAKKPKKSARDG